MSDETDKRKNPTWLKPYQFRPGQSGNPGGVSKHRKAMMDDTATKAVEVSNFFMTALHESLLKAAEQGPEAVVALLDTVRAKFIEDSIARTEGKPASSLDLTTDGEPITGPKEIRLTAAPFPKEEEDD